MMFILVILSWLQQAKLHTVVLRIFCVNQFPFGGGGGEVAGAMHNNYYDQLS